MPEYSSMDSNSDGFISSSEYDTNMKMHDDKMMRDGVAGGAGANTGVSPQSTADATSTSGISGRPTHASMDTNQDGKISKIEYDASVKMMMDRHHPAN